MSWNYPVALPYSPHLTSARACIIIFKTQFLRIKNSGSTISTTENILASRTNSRLSILSGLISRKSWLPARPCNCIQRYMNWQGRTCAAKRTRLRGQGLSNNRANTPVSDQHRSSNDVSLTARLGPQEFPADHINKNGIAAVKMTGMI